MKKYVSSLLLSISIVSLSIPIVVSRTNNLSPAVVSAISDGSNVIDDLFTADDFKTAYLNGEYVADSSKDEFDVLYVVESGYSFNHKKYELIIYVWNKSGNGFDTYNFENKYNSVEFYSFATYKAFSVDIQYINCSTDHQFLKYRVKNIDQANFLNAETGRREYGIKGIEIAHFEGDLQKFKEYPIAKKWNFEGEKDDLFVTYNSSFEYLQLELGSGAFPFSKWDDYYSPAYGGVPVDDYYAIHRQKNLYYVYFNIPKTYRNSGSLYSIHADYYDFDLSNKIAFLLDNHDQNYYVNNYNIFDDLLKNGETFSGNELLNENYNNYIFHAYFDQYENARGKTIGLGDQNITFHVAPIHAADSLITFGFNYTSTSFLEQYKILIPISDPTADVSGHVISSYFDRQTAERVSGQSSTEVYKEIHYCNPGTGREDSDAIETGWDLISVSNNHWAIWNWWHNVSDELNVSELKCIEHIDSSDTNLTNDAFQNKYYVNSNDTDSIKNYLSDDNDTYLFRFKLAESKTLEVDYGKGENYIGPISQNVGLDLDRVGFTAYEYHGVVDFDVLDMTFVNEDDELETLPVVSDPVNVFPDVPSPIRSIKGCGGFWQTFLMIVMMILLVLAIILLLKWFIPWRRNRQMIHAVKSSGKSSNNHSTVKHYNYNIKKTYINRPKSKKKKRRK